MGVAYYPYYNVITVMCVFIIKCRYINKKTTVYLTQISKRKKHLENRKLEGKQAANAFYNAYYAWTTITFFLYRLFMIRVVAFYPYYENRLYVHNQMNILTIQYVY